LLLNQALAGAEKRWTHGNSETEPNQVFLTTSECGRGVVGGTKREQEEKLDSKGMSKQKHA
jgi:hypothetical protein